MTTVLVVGLGRFGKGLVRGLAETRVEVIAVDMDEDAVADIKDLADEAVCADICDPEVLQRLCADGVDAAVVAVSRQIDQSALATMLLKEVGVPNLISRAESADQSRLLQKVGADRIVVPVSDSAERLARSLVSGAAQDFVLVGENFAVVERSVPASMAGQNLQQLELRRNHGVTVIAILERNPEDPGARPNMELPDPLKPLEEGDTMLLIGRSKDLERFENAT